MLHVLKLDSVFCCIQDKVPGAGGKCEHLTLLKCQRGGFLSRNIYIDGRQGFTGKRPRCLRLFPVQFFIRGEVGDDTGVCGGAQLLGVALHAAQIPDKERQFSKSLRVFLYVRTVNESGQVICQLLAGGLAVLVDESTQILVELTEA